MSSIFYTDRHGNTVKQNTKAMDRTGAFALVSYDCNVLMVKPRGNHDVWELPGGGVDAGEWIERGLKRELYEEIGIALPDNVELRPRCKMLFQYYPDDVKQFWNYNLYLFLLEFKFQPVVAAGNEIESVGWKPFDEWDSSSVNFIHRELIRHYFSVKDVPANNREYDDVLGYC